MRAASILNHSFKKSLNFLHKTQLKTMWFAVESLLRGGRLSLTALGREAINKTYAKHNIKRIDRFLGNIRFWVQLPELYRAITTKVLKNTLRPIILVDWTQVCEGMHAIVAAVPCQGRAQVIYSEVYPERLHGKPKIEKGFLKRLINIVPSYCKPVLITDAGFRSPWFDDVKKIGWDYVGRVRNNVHIKLKHGRWVPIKLIFKKATTKARDLGLGNLAKSKKAIHRFVLVKMKSRGRHSRTNCNKDKNYSASAKEPWLLATSLIISANKIGHLYSLRMQIEETFRDQKNTRFGWSLRHVRSKSENRLEVLLFVAALANLVVVIVGMIAEEAKLHLKYQANTIKKRRVLSWFVLGKLIIKDGALYLLNLDIKTFNEACEQIYAKWQVISL